MTRVFGHYVALEMVFLWLLEFVPCFLVLYVLLAHTPALDGGWVDLTAVSAAAILALTIGLTTIAIGLYRPEICLQTRRLLTNTAVAGLLAFPVALVVGHAAGIDTSLLIGGGLLRPLQLLLAWILFLFATRLALAVAVRLNLFARRVLIIGA